MNPKEQYEFAERLFYNKFYSDSFMIYSKLCKNEE